MISIPNPTKKITLNFSLEQVKKTILRIPVMSYPKYKLTSKNDIINLITLECFELLSLGVYVDLTLNSLEDNKTEINIEVRRKLGSFDESIEVQKASEHIINLINMIGSEVITMSDDEFNTKYSANITKIHSDISNAQKPWYAQKMVANAYIILGICTLPFIIGIIILPLGIYAKVKQKKYNKENN